MHIALILAAGIAAQTTYPMDTDHLVSQGGEAKVMMVLDESGSMNGDNLNLNCPVVPYQVDSKQDQLKAALTGCLTNADGIFDLWAGRVEFSVYGFGGASGVRQLVDFTDSVPALEAAVLGVQDAEDCDGTTPGIKACGNTPMTEGIRVAADHMKATFDTPGPADPDDDDRICNKYHMVVLGDGFPNAGGNQTFDQRCPVAGVPVPEVVATQDNPAPGSAYLGGGDVMCSIPEEQIFNTFTIGFGNPSSFNEALLVDMAQGDGFYSYASEVTELTNAFSRILQTISAKSAVTFGRTSISNDGLFAGNNAYVSSFQPASEGAWPGNLKKACLLPDRLPNNRWNTAENRCMFRGVLAGEAPGAEAGEFLVENDDAEDFFVAGEPLQDTLLGGAGRRMLDVNFGGVNPGDVNTYGATSYTRRSIYTWRPGTANYLQVQPGSLPASLTGLFGIPAARLFAFLHGYDPETIDPATLAPASFDNWPMGAVVNGGTAFMQYADDCATAFGCQVAVATNGGKISFIGSEDGLELLSLIPGDLWRAGNVTDRGLGMILDQPTLDYRRMPTVDGAMLVYHDDLDADSIIDASEDALLMVGLGHGGAAYYFVDVSSPFTNTAPTPASHPVYTVARTPGNWTEHMRSTMASPTVGVGSFPSAQDEKFIAFTSGGDWEAAIPSHDYSDFAGAFLTPPGVETTKTCNEVLSAGGASSLFCTPPDPALIALLGSYEAAINPAVLAVAPGGDAVPYDAEYTPVLDFPTRIEEVVGVTFSLVDLEPGDRIVISDLSDTELAVVDSSMNGTNVRVDFFAPDKTVVGDPTFHFRLETDGDPTNTVPGALGATVDVFHVIEEPQRAGGHRPFLAVLDVDAITAPARAFQSNYVPGGELLLVTSDCAGSGVSAGSCIDQTTSPALEDLRCPISAPPAPYTEGGQVRAFYFGDTCGQIWKVYTPNGGNDWEAIKLLELNEDFDPSSAAPGAFLSQNLRRIERTVDIFVTGCTGGRAVGVSFGTGNINRPAAVDDLDGADVATDAYPGFDVLGTVFDQNFQQSNLAQPLRLEEVATGIAAPGGETLANETCGGDCLTDVTNVDYADAEASDFRGFFFRLTEDERMLRDSLTVEGKTFYKTFKPTVPATSCDPAIGRDTAYVVTNCSGLGVGPDGSDPRVAGTNEDGSIGGNFLLITPKDGPPIVTAGLGSTDASGNAKRADLLQSQSSGVRMLFWYQPNN